MHIQLKSIQFEKTRKLTFISLCESKFLQGKLLIQIQFNFTHLWNFSKMFFWHPFGFSQHSSGNCFANDVFCPYLSIFIVGPFKEMLSQPGLPNIAHQNKANNSESQSQSQSQQQQQHVKLMRVIHDPLAMVDDNKTAGPEFTVTPKNPVDCVVILEKNIRMRNAINDVKFPRSILSTYN